MGLLSQVPRLRCVIRNFNAVCRLIEQVEEETFLSVGLGFPIAVRRDGDIADAGFLR